MSFASARTDSLGVFNLYFKVSFPEINKPVKTNFTDLFEKGGPGRHFCDRRLSHREGGPHV